MRIRQIKPSFWSDAKIADLSERTRLFYIGLWGIADDAGWFRWDAREIAVTLYGYETPRTREAKVVKCMAELVSAGRVVIAEDCGHAQVVHLADHQHLGGLNKQVRTVYTQHRACTPVSPRIPAHPRASPLSAAPLRSGNGQVRSGQLDALAHEENDELSLKTKVGWNG